MENHHRYTGSGNYNRFAPLVRERLPSKRKRQLPDEALAPDPKTPRLDANTVFAQLKDQDAALQEAKGILKKAVETGEECCSAKDGAIGTIIHSLLQVMSIMLTSHENITSALIDSVKFSQVDPPRNPHKGPPQITRLSPAMLPPQPLSRLLPPSLQRILLKKSSGTPSVRLRKRL